MSDFSIVKDPVFHGLVESAIDSKGPRYPVGDQYVCPLFDYLLDCGEELAAYDYRDRWRFKTKLGIEFQLVPRGEYWLAKDGVNARLQFTQPTEFWMAATPVTQEQWYDVVGFGNLLNFETELNLTPSGFPVAQVSAATIDGYSSNLPVESVSYNDVTQWIQLLNRFFSISDESGRRFVYCLPTEQEWEIACRGADRKGVHDFYGPDGGKNTIGPDEANFFHDTSLGQTTPCGSYPPNRLGLFDMHGNVWEWCESSNPTVLRGGSWLVDAGYCRSAYRLRYDPGYDDYDYGFRLAIRRMEPIE